MQPVNLEGERQEGGGGAHRNGELCVEVQVQVIKVTPELTGTAQLMGAMQPVN
jgi:hypothetical protein